MRLLSNLYIAAVADTEISVVRLWAPVKNQGDDQVEMTAENAFNSAHRSIDPRSMPAGKLGIVQRHTYTSPRVRQRFTNKK
jgi:hypothetical protein